MNSKKISKSGEYWKEHLLSWEASAYYKEQSTQSQSLGPALNHLPR